MLDALGLDDMRLLIDRARTALSPDLPSAVQPSIMFSRLSLLATQLLLPFRLQILTVSTPLPLFALLPRLHSR